MKLDLLTNATVVDDDAIRFIEKNSKGRRNDGDITQQYESDEEEITNKIF
jgi:hypothetical protein